MKKQIKHKQHTIILSSLLLIGITFAIFAWLASIRLPIKKISSSRKNTASSPGQKLIEEENRLLQLTGINTLFIQEPTTGATPYSSVISQLGFCPASNDFLNVPITDSNIEKKSQWAAQCLDGIEISEHWNSQQGGHLAAIQNHYMNKVVMQFFGSAQIKNPQKKSQLTHFKDAVKFNIRNSELMTRAAEIFLCDERAKLALYDINIPGLAEYEPGRYFLRNHTARIYMQRFPSGPQIGHEIVHGASATISFSDPRVIPAISIDWKTKTPLIQYKLAEAFPCGTEQFYTTWKKELKQNILAFKERAYSTSIESKKNKAFKKFLENAKNYQHSFEIFIPSFILRRIERHGIKAGDIINLKALGITQFHILNVFRFQPLMPEGYVAENYFKSLLGETDIEINMITSNTGKDGVCALIASPLAMESHINARFFIDFWSKAIPLSDGGDDKLSCSEAFPTMLQLNEAAQRTFFPETRKLLHSMLDDYEASLEGKATLRF